MTDSKCGRRTTFLTPPLKPFEGLFIDFFLIPSVTLLISLHFSPNASDDFLVLFCFWFQLFSKQCHNSRVPLLRIEWLDSLIKPTQNKNFTVHQKEDDAEKTMEPLLEVSFAARLGCCRNFSRLPVYMTLEKTVRQKTSCTPHQQGGMLGAHATRAHTHLTLTFSQSGRSLTLIPAIHTSPPQPEFLVRSNSSISIPTLF